MITFKGILNDEKIKNLQRKDTTGWSTVEPNTIDKAIAIFILMLPFFYGFKILIGPYEGNILEILVWDLLGLLCCVPIMCIHEVFHALAFGRGSSVEIWFYKFGMITYCVERVNKMKFLLILALPNIVLTLPISILMVVFPATISPLLSKTMALMMMVIVMGSYSDIKHIVYIIRNYATYTIYCVSGDEIYCK